MICALRGSNGKHRRIRRPGLCPLDDELPAAGSFSAAQDLGLLDKCLGGPGGIAIEQCPLPRILSEVDVLPERLQVSLLGSRELLREHAVRELQVAPSQHPCRPGPDHEEQRKQEGADGQASADACTR